MIELPKKAPKPEGHTRHAKMRTAGAWHGTLLGGLRPETLARLEAIAEAVDGKKRPLRGVPAKQRPVPGTRLIREWQGVDHTVTVLRDGYEWQGRPYQSLSAIARSITGTRWNGWVFFGLKNHRRSA